MMKILSINTAKPQSIRINNTTITTCIFKRSVPHAVRFTKLRLEGDSQADLSVHGGVDKAVYFYPHEHYSFWRKELCRTEFPFGQFGENVTLEGGTEDRLSIGDVLQFGTVVVQITQPRQPCVKLAHVMNRTDFLKRFLESGRVGFYARVLEEGEAEAGEEVRLVERDPVGFSVRRMSRLIHFETHDRHELEAALRIQGLPPKLRAEFQHRLAYRSPSSG